MPFCYYHSLFCGASLCLKSNSVPLLPLPNVLVFTKMIDPVLQKGFIPGINGCVDHNLVMDEIIKDARMKRRTVHITFFDLADAFGSVPHQLIFDTFKRLHMPEQIIKYLKGFYSNLMSKVVTTKFNSEEFKFKRGVT